MIEACDIEETPKKSWRITFTIGAVQDSGKVVVCKESFAEAYSRSRAYVDNIIKDIKESGEIFRNFDRPFNGATVVDKSCAPMMKLLLAEAAHGSSPDVQAVIKSWNVVEAFSNQSPAFMICHEWMKDYFNLVGDKPPNTAGEIHLDYTSKKAIHLLYLQVP